MKANSPPRPITRRPWSRRSLRPTSRAKGKIAQLIVVGRSINIHFHLNQLKEALGYDNMRYKEAFSGGQFGIKVWIITEAIAGAAALHFKRPVRYAPTMAESMLITTKRHAYPSMKVKLAADAEGHLTAFFCDFTMDKGAYTVNGPVILGRAIMMIQGSYNIPNHQGLRASRSIPTTPSAVRPAAPGHPRPPLPRNRPWTCWRKRWGSTRWSSAG